MHVRRWLRRGLAIAAATPLLAACDFSGPQSALAPAGWVAQQQLDLFMWTLYLSIPVMVGVFGVLAYVLIRYRAKDANDAKAVPHQTHGNTKLEIAWTIIPVILVILIAVPTVRAIFETEQRVTPQAGDIVIHATGYQWWFRFDYVQHGFTTANEMVIPVGARVIVSLDSADVLHSFWVPRLAGKRDMIPNNDNQTWFIADEPGEFYGQCAELCLGAHAYMRFRVIAKEPAEYQAWVDSFTNASTHTISADPLVQQGKMLTAQKGCIGCHRIDGYMPGVQVGNLNFPTLTNFGLRTTVGAAIADNTPENLAAWLRDPQAMKPTNRMPTLWREDDPNREQEIAAIVAYLLSLGTEPTTTAQLNLGGTHGGQ